MTVTSVVLKSWRLDDWYRELNKIYFDRNYYRTSDSILCHLVEVARGLGVAAEGKKRKKDINAEEFFPKTMAWWLALCGRVGIPSVETMVWAKFPAVCPYCRLKVHQSTECKERKPANAEVDWQELAGLANDHKTEKPTTLGGWQTMFAKIYPRDDRTDHALNTRRLQEELGELAEAVRVLPAAPEYFVSEAPDVFAWLMGFANQFDFDAHPTPAEPMLSRSLAAAYPGVCPSCRHRVCKCPPVPPETLGRLAKEAPLTSVFPDHPRLLTSADCMALFTASTEVFRIGDKEVAVKPAEFTALATDLRKIQEQMADHVELQEATYMKVFTTLALLEGSAREGTVRQETLEEILKQLKAMPSEKRALLLGFANNVISNVLVGTLFAVAAK